MCNHCYQNESYQSESRTLTLWQLGGFGDFRKKRLNACGFVLEYLRCYTGYGPGRSVKRRGKFSSLHSKKFFAWEMSFFVSDVISGGLLGDLAHFAWPWAPTVRW